MQNFSKKLDKQIGSITSGLAKIGVAAAGVAVGFGLLIKKTSATNDQLAKTADKIGTTTEELSKLRFAAELTGVSSNTLDMALQRMTRRLSEAANDSGEAKAALKELGLNAKELAQIPLSQQVSIIADAMDGLGSQADRVRIAMKLFDSEGVALVNTLRGGSSQLEEYGKRAERLGIVVDTKTAKASEALNDNITILTSNFDGLALRIGTKVIPFFVNLTSKMINFFDNIDLNFLGEFIIKIENLANKILDLIVAIAALIVALKTYTIALSIASKATTFFSIAIKNIPIVKAATALGLLSDSVVDNSKSFTQLIEKFKELGKVDVPQLGDSPNASGVFVPDRNKVGLGGANDDIDKVKTFKEQMEDFYKTITDLNTQFANAFQNAFQGLEDSILDFVKTGKFEFKDLANSIIDDISRIAIKQAIIAPISQAASSAFGGLFGGATGGTGDIFGGFFARGGRPDTGKVSVVGENGPELFVPDSAGRVIPNNQLSTTSNGGNGTYNKADVSITINAIDTQTGVSFLIANKDVISGIINTNLGTNGSTRSLI